MLVVHVQLAKKHKESKVLVSCIKRISFEMYLCSKCEKRNLKYVVSNKENLNYYFKYVFQGASCNVKDILVNK